jgi:hypothetical protein
MRCARRSRIVISQFNLAGVHANAHRKANSMQRIANGASAVDRPRRTVEGGQETVTEGFHLPSPKPRKLLAHRFVVGVKKVSPCEIALNAGAYG